MNIRKKYEWVQALYSGEYAQTKGKLKDVNRGVESFCCLGVLCDISGRGEWKRVDDAFENCVEYLIGDERYGSITSLPYLLQKEYGLYEDHIECLTEMNDNGHSFTEIGDWIRLNIGID